MYAGCGFTLRPRTHQARRWGPSKTQNVELETAEVSVPLVRRLLTRIEVCVGPGRRQALSAAVKPSHWAARLNAAEVPMLFTQACRLALMAATVSTVIGCAAKAAKPTTVLVCGAPITVSPHVPPVDIGPVVLMATPCLQPPAGGVPSIPAAYRRHIQLQASRPSEGFWVPYDEAAQHVVQADYRRLWETGRLRDLRISVTGHLFSNGVVGKFVTYTIEETDRQPANDEHSSSPTMPE